MMKYMLDTNICIYIIKKKPSKVFEKFKSLKMGQVCISAITYSEMQFGIHNSTKPIENQQALNKFLGPIEVLDYPASAGQIYGKVRSELQSKGKSIGGNDLLIASHALNTGSILVTNNVKEFKRIKELNIENWA